MRVRLTDQALDDLKSIADWIGSDNRPRAESFSAELRAKCLDLGDKPERFPVADELRDVGVRKRVHGRYLILYRVHRSEVEVVRVVHGARDLRSLLGQ